MKLAAVLCDFFRKKTNIETMHWAKGVPTAKKKMARTLWNRIIERVLLLECVNRAKTRTTSTNDIDTTRNITGIHDRMNQQG